MSARLLITGAGSIATQNLVRSIRAGLPQAFIVGCNDDRFVLSRSTADRKYLLPGAPLRSVGAALRSVVARENIDLIVPNSDADVATLTALRQTLGCRTFLPRLSVIERCQDKFALSVYLCRRGFPVPRTYAVHTVDELEALFERFRPASQLWCRLRRGSGSAGAILVTRPAQARAWIHYWEDVCGVAAGMFTLSEYLPGRDLTVQILFENGRPIMTKMYERLSYHVVGGGGPSGVSSTAALAKMVYEPRLLKLSARAVQTLDPAARGVYFVDLKEDEAGRACITEINAGRFANVPTIHDALGSDNMAAAYVQLALGFDVPARKARRYAEDCYIARGLDAMPAMLRNRELLDDIRDVRTLAQRRAVWRQSGTKTGGKPRLQGLDRA